MYEAPAFHQAPRPVAVALRARSTSSPKAISFRQRVFGLRHCSHKILRKRRLWEKMRALFYDYALESMQQLFEALLYGLKKSAPIVASDTS